MRVEAVSYPPRRSGGRVIVQFDSGFKVGLKGKSGGWEMWDLAMSGCGYYIIIMMMHDDVRCMMLQLQHYHYHHVP